MQVIQIDGAQVVLNSAQELSIREEIIDKVKFLLSCIKGTIPYNREIGLDPDIIASPPFIAQNLYTVSAIDLIETFEDRVRVEEVQFTPGGDDSENLIPKVVLKYNV